MAGVFSPPSGSRTHNYAIADKNRAGRFQNQRWFEVARFDNAIVFKKPQSFRVEKYTSEGKPQETGLRGIA